MILIHGANSLSVGGGANVLELGGETYELVQIGNQLWTNRNIEYIYDGLTVGPGGNPNIEAAWWPNNDEATYKPALSGLLYTQYAVEHINSVLPAGFRCPTQQDYQNLITYLNSLGQYSDPKLYLCGQNDDTNWNAYCYRGDPFGFNLLPFGSRYDGRFGYIGQEAVQWTNTSRKRFICGSGTPTEINERDRNRGQNLRIIKVTT